MFRTEELQDVQRFCSRFKFFRERIFPKAGKFANAVGAAKSRISRIETGKELPSREYLDAWIRSLNADAVEASELQTLLHDAQRAKQSADQANYVFQRFEPQARRIAWFQQGDVPFLLKTQSYIRAMVESEYLTALCRYSLRNMLSAHALRTQIWNRRDIEAHFYIRSLLLSKSCTWSIVMELLSHMRQILESHPSVSITFIHRRAGRKRRTRKGYDASRKAHRSERRLKLTAQEWGGTDPNKPILDDIDNWDASDIVYDRKLWLTCCLSPQMEAPVTRWRADAEQVLLDTWSRMISAGIDGRIAIPQMISLVNESSNEQYQRLLTMDVCDWIQEREGSGALLPV